MKIPLKLGQSVTTSSIAAQAKALEQDVLKAKGGDWTAKKRLARTFSPLINSLAEKRSSEPAKINQYIEAGKNGLLTATKKYKKSVGAQNFQIFALDFIETAMNRVDKGGGFFSRLFGGKS